MTKLIYLEDSYKKTLTTKITNVKTKNSLVEVTLAETIFYPLGGGQPSDRGTIKGKSGQLQVSHVRLQQTEVIHAGKITGALKVGERIDCEIDWPRRYEHMRRHSAGHVLHEVVMETVPDLTPIKGEHSQPAYVEYRGYINPKLAETLAKKANMLIAADKKITSRFVTLAELKREASWIPLRLPNNKPLRVIQIEGYRPIPDGGTQVHTTGEIGEISQVRIENNPTTCRLFYEIIKLPEKQTQISHKFKTLPLKSTMTLTNFQTLLLEIQRELTDVVAAARPNELEAVKLKYLGSHGKATLLIHRLKELSINEKKAAGALVNAFKQSAIEQISQKIATTEPKPAVWYDTSLPGISPPEGHLHIVTQAIFEITRIFERLGFTRVRYPEVDWDWYAFESLNMPPDHPARDEWETFFIDYPEVPTQTTRRVKQLGTSGNKFNQIVLTPHTSNGQVREMEKGKLPIRIINIAKCYRRQLDVSHTPMFHQFEGLYIDKNVSIGHLKGVVDYFFKQYYGADRKSRLRPFHFQFTEPSFEIDVSCGICSGKGRLSSGEICRLCKEGWLELGGAGMVHPLVLQNGGIDPEKWTGFAFGWGIERTSMMKTGTQLDDIRLLYSNDLRFLEQF